MNIQKLAIRVKNFPGNFTDINITDRYKKNAAINKIKIFAKSIKANKKNILIEDLIEETNVEHSSQEAKDYEVMTWNDIREINSHSLFSVGGHSMYHDILTNLPSEEMESDILSCQNLISSELEQKISHFSYPEGKTSDYNDNIIKTLKKLGVKCSPTAELGLNSKDTDPFKLKRVMVGMMDIKFSFNL